MAARAALMALVTVAAAAVAVAAAEPGAAAAWMDTSDPPAARAQKLLAAMNLTEKVHMLHGSGSGYVGNVEANTRLGIPALKLNDGPQGFRGISGTSTAWPSGLTIGASFDVDAASKWGTAMGVEFYGKGANVQLGPGLCLARVPKCGRNFEYISGEDPFLGATMVAPVITGIQSKGVIANAKHWVDNSQETNRHTVSEVVGEREEFELYYPPFEGAVNAGVGSVMCSYNKINGTWSCENPNHLARDLKQRLNFSGWVMSDWGATHSTSITAGLDQEMPGANFMGDALLAAVKGGSIPQSAVDDATLRILTPMFQMGVFDYNNTGTLQTNVTSPAHNALARELAAGSMVLLKNVDKALPLDDTVTSIAIIGDQAANPIVHGGGSGQVVPYYVAAPLDSFRARFGIVTPPPGPSNCSEAHWTTGIDYRNQDSQTSAPAGSAMDCCNLCASRGGGQPCNAFTFVGGTCWMKGDAHNPVKDGSAVSGIVRVAPPAPAANCSSGSPKRCIYYADGTDVNEAAAIAAMADVAIVFAATTSSEGSDRTTLNLTSNNGQANMLIEAVAKAAKRTVVSMVQPGAVVTPWRDDVDAIIAAFMPGQEYGNAVMDVIFGDKEPSGRLPLTFPAFEGQEAFTPSQWPGVNLVSTYSEHLEVGYRYYDAKNLAPAFPFGHGLGYTTFAYTGLQASAAGVSVTITNTGSRDGAATPQLYLGFPSSAGEPPKQLKGFSKVDVKAGASATVTMPLNDRSFSIWDTASHSWAVQHGDFSVMVGASSRDIRLTGTLTV
uniref:Probable beta-glucosidase G n=1 Tax=Bicosoecida sp. CB-2014 TaxID=1486930 RepID=A0A7S1CC37_9STRA|mmetsp:Transcript_19268/g.68074  ORF Transcript_19268/g.68074 Transcript_19268/m.68074 type:complete len:780 (+) Transcript_19268:70-2409(+)